MSSHKGPTRLSEASTPGPSPAPARLTPLSRPVRAALRSTLVIPTLPQVLSELLHNSLDAQAGKIDIWIDPSKEGQSIRVEDDGIGISGGSGGLGVVGGRWRSSKGGTWGRSGNEEGGYGFRGEALASIAALGLLEIITRPQGSQETFAKVIRGSTVLFEGVSTRSLGRERGTTVVVKDLFHDIPIRQASLSATASTLLASCKKVVETLALVRPNVKWTLWEEATVGSSTAGGGLKKVLSVSGGRSSVDVFRGIYGIAGVEKVQSIRVSSGTKRIDGFISLSGTVTRSHQHLYVNGYPIDKCELHAVISKQFSKSKFSEAGDDGSHDSMVRNSSSRKSPRRLERHPVYVLNIQLPPSDLDASYTPGKTVMGYADEAAVQKFLLAVIDEFLRRHEFVNPAKKTTSDPVPIRGVTPIRPESAPVPGRGMAPPITPRTGRPASALSGPRSQRLGFPQSVTETPSVSAEERRTEKKTYAEWQSSDRVTPECFTPKAEVSNKPIRDRPASTSRGTGGLPDIESRSFVSTPQLGDKRNTEMISGDYVVDESGRKRYKWIDDILAGVDSEILPFTPKESAALDAQPDFPNTCCHDGPGPGHIKDHTHHSLPIRPLNTPIPHSQPTSKITFSGSSLSRATVLGQIDFKFIVALVPSCESTSSPTKTIVLIDQHAADERVSIESILTELCEGFISDSIPITELAEPLPAIILSRQEVGQLCAKGVRDVFARWGIELDISDVQTNEGEQGEEGGYVQIPIRAVPTVLKARLCRTEASEMTRLVKLYLDVLGSPGLGQIEALIRKGDKGDVRVDWGEVLRWMPKEMLELANSKACRNAIMFGDRLTIEQCERLVRQLGKMRFPFMCAHGRPSLVPIMKLEGEVVGGKRRINWEEWKDGVGL